jgi:hypothetical protein
LVPVLLAHVNALIYRCGIILTMASCKVVNTATGVATSVAAASAAIVAWVSKARIHCALSVTHRGVVANTALLAVGATSIRAVGVPVSIVTGDSVALAT